MTNSRGLRQKIIFMAVLITYGLVLFSVAGYLKIGLRTTPRDIVLQVFANSRDAGQRLMEKISESRTEKSTKVLLKIEERK